MSLAGRSGLKSPGNFETLTALRAHHATGTLARVLAVVTLICATPGTAQVVREFACFAVGEDSCAECADEGSEQNCAESCVCCAHSNALPTAAPLQGAGHVSREAKFSERGQGPYSAGYRSPPFRPPAV